ncbi:MAG: hypothetical protein KBD39_01575 [Sterolibacterium sp.]|nr:hypothetical protein [Sterolibacterium sp.]
MAQLPVLSVATKFRLLEHAAEDVMLQAEGPCGALDVVEYLDRGGHLAQKIQGSSTAE